MSDIIVKSVGFPEQLHINVSHDNVISANLTEDQMSQLIGYTYSKKEIEDILKNNRGSVLETTYSKDEINSMVYGKAQVDQKISTLDTKLSDKITSDVQTLSDSVDKLLERKANVADVYSKDNADARFVSNTVFNQKTSQIDTQLSQVKSSMLPNTGGTINGSLEVTNGLTPLPLGQGAVATDASGQVLFKSVNSDDAPNNGFLIEFGYNTTYKGRLYIGDSPEKGVWIGGLDDGKLKPWKRLVTVDEVPQISGDSIKFGNVTISVE